MRKNVNFTLVNKIEATDGRLSVDVKIESRAAFHTLLLFLHTDKIYLPTQVKITRQWKSTFRDPERSVTS